LNTTGGPYKPLW